MSKNTSELMISSELKIKTEDVISVAISQIETSLEEAIKRNSDEIKDLTDDRNDAQSKYHDSLNEAARNHFSTDMQILVKAFTSVKCDKGCTTIANKNISYGYSVCTNEQGKLVVVLNSCIDGIRSGFHYTTPLSSIPEAKAARDLMDKLSDQIQALVKNSIDLKCKLGDIGRLERKARAAAATVVISETAEGEAYLQKIKDHIVSNDKVLRLLDKN